MKLLIIFLSLLNAQLIRAQNINSFSYEKKYKSISIASVEEVLPNIEKDTIKVIDTIFLKENKIQSDLSNQLPNRTSNAVLVYSPLNALQITSKYGMRFHPIKKQWIFHSGVDFQANQDTVMSVLKGMVHSSGYNDGLGYYVKVESGNYVITYGHLSQYFHLENENIEAGQSLGITGSTGLSTGEHLHFSVHHKGNSIDPINFLKALVNLKSTLALNKENTIQKNITNSLVGSK